MLTWFLAKPEHFGSFTHVVIDEADQSCCCFLECRALFLAGS